MNYIAIITWRDQGFECYAVEELARLTSWVRPSPRLRCDPWPADLTLADLPATYESERMSAIVRVPTPEDMAYINAGCELLDRFPMWLTPAGAVPLKPIVKSNGAGISD